MQSSQDHILPERQIVSSGAISVTVLCAIVLAGVCNLIYPFNGDQALFTIGAKCLANGGVLYRDFWDLKQPGIYWFYHLAGAIGGYNEIGIHAFELVWFCTLAILISVVTRDVFRIRWMRDICALLTVGVYFSVCGSWHLTQLEGLVWLPIFLCLWLVILSPPTRLRWILFGFLVAVIACFKLLLVAIPGVFFIGALLPGRGLKDCVRAVGLSAFGFSILLVPVICYFAWQHQLEVIYETFFVYPPRIVKELPMNKAIVLLRGGRWFALAGGPLFVLAAIGFYSRLRKGLDRFTATIVSWICVASVLVLIQHMWWEYHFLLILFPLGILASLGLEDCLVRLRPHGRFAGYALIVFVLLPYGFRTGHKAFAEGMKNFRWHISSEYADAAGECGWLETQPEARDEIYVLGNPLIYFLSHHAQSVPINGWSPEFLLKEQWTKLAQQLRQAKTPFIFISSDADQVVKVRGEEIANLLKSYHPVHRSDVGIWYAIDKGK